MSIERKSQAQNIKQKETNDIKNSIRTLLWNIEGIKNAVQLATADLFQPYDVIILTETYYLL